MWTDCENAGIGGGTGTSRRTKAKSLVINNLIFCFRLFSFNFFTLKLMEGGKGNCENPKGKGHFRPDEESGREGCPKKHYKPKIYL